MTFLGLVFKNIARHKFRSILTIFGISIGVMTIVSMTIMGEGVKNTTEDLLKAGGADLNVFQKGASDVMFSSVPESKEKDLLDLNFVSEVDGQLFHILRTKASPFFFLIGTSPDGFSIKDLEVTEGRNLSAKSKEIVLGKIAADNLKLKAGDTFPIDSVKYKVVGIFESSNIYYNGGGLVSLKDAQKLANKPGQATLFLVKLKKGTDVKSASKQIEKKVSGVTVVASLEDVAKVDQGTEALDAIAWGISLLAIIIGGIGVMNTMVMSVFERTREIGVLKAVGWSSRRVLAMILMESLFITIVAALVGLGLGVLVVKGVTMVPAVNMILKPAFTSKAFIRAVVVAVGVGLFGGIFPAIRASRLSPMGALRYE